MPECRVKFVKRGVVNASCRRVEKSGGTTSEQGIHGRVSFESQVVLNHVRDSIAACEDVELQLREWIRNNRRIKFHTELDVVS